MADKIITKSEEIDNEKVTSKPQKRKNSKVFTSLVEWRDYAFFYCSDEEKEEAIKILIEHELLNSDSKPNNAKIKENSNYFGESLATRLSDSYTVKALVLTNLASVLLNLLAEKDYKAMYYFTVYLYGITRWRTPYNLQRTPVSSALLKSYMTHFCEAFCLKVNEITEELNEENI